MQFPEFLKQSAVEIDNELNNLLTLWYKDVDQFSPEILPHIKSFGSAAADGKRIRGALIILGYSLVSKTPNQELLKIAEDYVGMAQTRNQIYKLEQTFKAR